MIIHLDFVRRLGMSGSILLVPLHAFRTPTDVPNADKLTLLHRMTECGAGQQIWKWTQKRLATILKTSPKDIPVEWTLRPNFSTRQIQRHRAILWLIAHLVYYQTQRDTQNTLQDYADFLRRALEGANRRQTGGGELPTNDIDRRTNNNVLPRQSCCT